MFSMNPFLMSPQLNAAKAADRRAGGSSPSRPSGRSFFDRFADPFRDIVDNAVEDVVAPAGRALASPFTNVAHAVAKAHANQVANPSAGTPTSTLLGMGDFMSDPAIVAAVNAQVAAMNRPLKSQRRERKADLRNEVTMIDTLGDEFQREAGASRSASEARARQRAANRKVERSKQAQEAAERARHTNAGLQADHASQAAMDATTQDAASRMRELLRADAEYSTGSSQGMQDVMASIEASAGQQVGEDTREARKSANKDLRSIDDQITANRQQKPLLLQQLAQQAYENQLALEQARQAAEKNQVEIDLGRAELEGGGASGMKPLTIQEVRKMLVGSPIKVTDPKTGAEGYQGFGQPSSYDEAVTSVMLAGYDEGTARRIVDTTLPNLVPNPKSKPKKKPKKKDGFMNKYGPSSWFINPANFDEPGWNYPWSKGADWNPFN